MIRISPALSELRCGLKSNAREMSHKRKICARQHNQYTMIALKSFYTMHNLWGRYFGHSNIELCMRIKCEKCITTFFQRLINFTQYESPGVDVVIIVNTHMYVCTTLTVCGKCGHLLLQYKPHLKYVIALKSITHLHKSYFVYFV